MNERIKELAEQAGIITNLDTDFFEKDPNKWVDYYSEKFAELIVRECVQVAGDNAVSLDETPDPIIGMAKLEVVKAIIRHFGVES